MPTAWSPMVDLDVGTLAVDGSTVYLGGGFASVDGLAQSFIAAIGGATLDVPVGANRSSVATRMENLPNPFRTSTTIRFTLRSEAQVTLDVFDVAGRLMTTLLRDEHVAAGPHQVEFKNPGLAGGLYVARLHAGGTLLATKLMMTR